MATNRRQAIKGFATVAAFSGIGSNTKADTSIGSESIQKSSVNSTHRSVDLHNFSGQSISRQIEVLRARLGNLPSKLPNLTAQRLIDDALPLVGQPGDFNPLHVDHLLNQAEELMERCIEDRRVWRDTYLRAYMIQFELEQFERLDEIQQAEDKAGMAEVDSKTAAGVYAAERETFDGLARSTTLAEAVERLYGSRRNAIITDFRTTASKEGSDPEVAATRANATMLAAELDVLSMRGRLRAKREDLDVAATLAESEALKAAFKKIRTEAIREMYRTRRTELSREGGPSNFQEQLNALKDSFNDHLHEALARYEAAIVGVKLVFNLPVQSEIPKVKQALESSNNTDDLRVIDSVAKGIRRLRYSIQRFTQRDETAVVQTNLRELLAADWDRLKAGEEVAVKFSAAFLSGALAPRLRGIAVYSTGAEFRELSIVIKAPREAERIDINGKTYKESQDLPSIIVGGVRPILWNAPRDFWGGSSLHNASPIGDWRFKLQKSHSLVNFPDLIVEYLIAVRPAKQA